MVFGCYWGSFPILFLASVFFSEIVLLNEVLLPYRMDKLQLLLCYSRSLTYYPNRPSFVLWYFIATNTYGLLLQSTQRQTWYHLVDGIHCLKLSKIQVIFKSFILWQLLWDAKDKCCISSWNLSFISVSNVNVSFALSKSNILFNGNHKMRELWKRFTKNMDFHPSILDFNPHVSYWTNITFLPKMNLQSLSESSWRTSM